MTVEIGPVRPDEHEVVGDLVLTAYRDVGSHHEAEYEAEVRDVAGRAALAGVCVLVARRDGVVLGSATVVLDNPELAENDDPQIAALRMLAVAPAAQGLGVGRALTLQAIELARARRLLGISLHTQPMMVAAQRLYRSLGFERQPERDWLVPDGPTLLFFQLRF